MSGNSPVFFISIGSNIEPETYIPKCLRLLQKQFPGILFSSIYETAPVGTSHQKKFWNLAASFSSSTAENKIREGLKQIENLLGRTRDPQDKFAPRTIDIDLLPQKQYDRFAFIMIPLAEIAPDITDPGTGKTFRQLAEAIDLSKQPCRKLSPANK